MDHCNDVALQYTERYKPMLAIVEPVILNSKCIAIKNFSYVFKINAMPFDIGIVFVFIPLKFHKPVSF
jgi:hypothetical protein